MALEMGPRFAWTVPAAVDLTTSQFLLVKYVPGTDSVTPVTAITDKPLGVLNNAPIAGDSAEVVMSGVTKVKLGATVAIDDQVGAKADGSVITWAATGTYLIGRALEAGVIGQIISVAISTAAMTAHA
jgi:hypothetical protein